MTSIDLLRLKEAAKTKLIGAGKDPARVDEYLDDPFGFGVLDPLNFDWEVTERNVLHDFNTWHEWMQTRKDR